MATMGWILALTEALVFVWLRFVFGLSWVSAVAWTAITAVVLVIALILVVLWALSKTDIG